MVTDEQTFFDMIFPGTLRDLRAKTTPQHIVFQTTRLVGTQTAGLVPTNSSSLTIQIESGLTEMERFNLAGGLEGSRKQQVDEAFIDGTHALIAKMSEELETAAVLIKYLSSTAFAWELTKLMHQCRRYPKLPMILVICQCDKDEKTSQIDRVLIGRDNAHLIIAETCSGEAVLGRMCNELIAAFARNEVG